MARQHDAGEGGLDEGVSPVVRESALGALLDSPIQLVPQHWKKRGSLAAVCGAGGQLAATEGAVTCDACKTHLAKAAARRERRSNTKHATQVAAAAIACGAPGAVVAKLAVAAKLGVDPNSVAIVEGSVSVSKRLSEKLGWGSPRARREDGIDYDFDRAMERAEAEDAASTRGSR